MVKRFPSGSSFVEVGVFEGQSLAYLLVEIINAKRLIGVTAVDSFEGNEDRKDNAGLKDRFRKNLKPVEFKYHLMIGNSTIIAEKYYNESFDFVFIDADHTYESVKNDILTWLPKVKKGGVIAGHDYFSEGEGYEGLRKAVIEIFGKVDESYIDERCWFIEL